ncbi:hypothetical protein HYT57_02640 [Candidatus Woesearchaeota archaeon]|nr:hypothetical protein [Candidatus Woesearchaeota archaeon]
MKEIEESKTGLMERVLDSNWLYNTLLISFTSLGVISSLGQAYFTIKSINPSSPIYRDINGDGIPDKVAQIRVKKTGFLGNFSALEDEVFFGIESDGKTLYLKKSEFEEYNQKTH